MARLKLKKLEEYLEDVEVFENPKIELEQYTTTPHLTAIILHTIQSRYQDLENKIICDLGCGCGILSIGAIMLGSSFCFGFEIDTDAIEILNHNINELEVQNFQVVNCNVTDISDKWDNFFDTVIMNPPFGTRNKGIDSKFLDVALRIGKVVYSMHKSSTRDYWLKKSKGLGIECQIIAELKFNLSNTYRFHTKNSVDIAVDLVRFKQ